MGLFDRLLKRSGKTNVGVTERPECPHSAIVPRWENLEDMGKDDLISGYHCDACGQNFTREEGVRILEEERRRLQA